MIEIYKQTKEEITNDILDNLPETYQKSVGFPIRDFIRAIAIFLSEILENVKVVLSWQNVDNMTGETLRRWVFQRRGIVWKSATHSTTILTTTGSGFNISKGTIIGESDTGLYFACVNDVVSETGSEEIEVECVTAGTVGNIPIGSISKIPVTIDGLSTVYNNVEASGGYDDETDEALRERYYEDLQLPIVSGNKNHYRQWAKEITGVKDAKVKALWNGDNTVKVIILDEVNLIAGDDLVKQVQDYIDPYDEVDNERIGWGEGNGQAPCGSYCTVESARAKDLTISANIEMLAGYDFETVTENIRNSINEYLREIAFDKQGLVSYTQISSYILRADGVKDHTGMLLNGGIENVRVADTDTYCEVAILNTLELTEVQA